MSQMLRLIRKSFQVLLGSFLSALGIKMFIFGGWGVDPISTLLLGIVNHVDLLFGTASQLFNIIILLLVFLIDNKKIGLGSLINALSVGFFINVLSILNMNSFLAGPRVIYVILGPIVLGFGTGIYLLANLGCGALEGLMMILSEKTNVSIKFIRMFLDFVLVVSGIALGGTYGVGTILGVFLIGPVIELTIRGNEKMKNYRKIKLRV